MTVLWATLTYVREEGSIFRGLAIFRSRLRSEQNLSVIWNLRNRPKTRSYYERNGLLKTPKVEIFSQNDSKSNTQSAIGVTQTAPASFREEGAI